MVGFHRQRHLYLGQVCADLVWGRCLVQKMLELLFG